MNLIHSLIHSFICFHFIYVYEEGEKVPVFFKCELNDEIIVHNMFL